jgi:transposase
MNFVGIDLHKKSISVCVVDQNRQVLDRERFSCSAGKGIQEFFELLYPFQAVIEATAGYEWLFRLLDPLAEEIVLAHPQKLRIIAESTRKSDQLDAQVLAEFLALDMIPLAYRPTPRERAHRRLVRQRVFLKKRIKAVRCKIRAILTDYNADRKDLFTLEGLSYLARVKVSDSDRFVLDQLTRAWEFHMDQCVALDKRLREFAKSAKPQEAEARAVLDSIPGVGPVTIETVLSELGTLTRFRSQKRVCAYAGLVPGQRESAGHRRALGITKQGSPLLRWVLTEAAWRLVNQSRYWQTVFASLAKRRGRKRAIIAVARRLLCLMVSLVQSGRRYQAARV